MGSEYFGLLLNYYYSVVIGSNLYKWVRISFIIGMITNRRQVMWMLGASVLSSSSVGCAIRHVATPLRTRTIEDVVGSIDWLAVPSEREVRESLPVIFEYLTGERLDGHVDELHFYDRPTGDVMDSGVLAYFNYGTQDVTFNMFNFDDSDGVDFWATTFHESGHSISLKVDEEMSTVYEGCGAVTENQKSVVMNVLGFVSGLTDEQKEKLKVRDYVTSTLSELEAISFNLASIVKMGNVSGFPRDKYLNGKIVSYLKESDSFGIDNLLSNNIFGDNNLPKLFSKYTFSNYFLLVLAGDFDYDLELTYNYIRDASNEELIERGISIGERPSVYKLRSAIEGVAERYNVVIDLPDITKDDLRDEINPVVKLLRNYSWGISSSDFDGLSFLDELDQGKIKFEAGKGYDPETVLEDSDFLAYVALVYTGLVEHMSTQTELDDDFYSGMEDTLCSFIENNPDNRFLFAAYNDLLKLDIAQHDWHGVVEHVGEFVERNPESPYCVPFLDRRMEVQAEVLQDYDGALDTGGMLSNLIRERGEEIGFTSAHNANITVYSFVMFQRAGNHEFAAENLRAYVDSINEAVEAKPHLEPFSDMVYFLSEANLYLARSLEEVGETEEAREIYRSLLGHVGGVNGRRGSHLVKEYVNESNDSEIVNDLYMRRKSDMDFIDILPIAKFAEWRLSLL